MPSKRQLRQKASAAPQRGQANATDQASKRRKKDPNPSAALPSRFLQLPQELRDRIYDDVWMQKPPFSITYRGSPFLVEYGPTSSIARSHLLERYGSPPPSDRYTFPEQSRGRGQRREQQKRLLWFLASRQVTYEAIAQFNHKATWTFAANRFKRWTVQPVPSKLLISPWEAHMLDLRTLYMSELAELQSNENSMRTLVRLHTPLALPLRYSGTGTTGLTSVRVFVFELSIEKGTSRSWAADRPIDVDLMPLARLNMPKLQGVRLTVVFNWESDLDDAAKLRVKEAVSELGSMLLGAEIKETVEVVQVLQEVKWKYEFIKA